VDNLLAICTGIALITAAIVALGKLAMMVRVAARTIAGWDRLLHTLAVEFQPNGGSTMRDAVDRLEQSCSAQEVRLVRLELDVQALRHEADGE
jgi:hypothetical protein